MLKKCISLFFFVSVLFLSGCELLQNDLTLFAETYKNMSEAKNFEMNLSLDIEINKEKLVDQSLDILYDFESDEVGKLQMDVFGMPMIFEVDETNATAYVKVNSTWVKSSQSVKDLIDEADFDADDYSFLSDKNVKYKVISEGEKLNVYEFTLTDTSFLTESLNGYEELLLNQIDMSKTEFDDLIKNIKLLVSIDKQNKQITELELDLTEMLNNALNTETSNEIEVNTFVITLKLSNYNGVDIKITDEMKNAQEFDLNF